MILLYLLIDYVMIMMFDTLSLMNELNSKVQSMLYSVNETIMLSKTCNQSCEEYDEMCQKIKANINSDYKYKESKKYHAKLYQCTLNPSEVQFFSDGSRNRMKSFIDQIDGMLHKDKKLKKKMRKQTKKTTYSVLKKGGIVDGLTERNELFQNLEIDSKSDSLTQEAYNKVLNKKGLIERSIKKD